MRRNKNIDLVLALISVFLCADHLMAQESVGSTKRTKSDQKTDVKEQGKAQEELVKSEFLEEQFKVRMHKFIEKAVKDGLPPPPQTQIEKSSEKNKEQLPGLFMVTKNERDRLANKKFDSKHAKARIEKQMRAASDASIDLPEVVTLFANDLKDDKLDDAQLELAAHFCDVVIPLKIEREKKKQNQQGTKPDASDSKKTADNE